MTAAAGASWVAIASLLLGVLNLAFIILNYQRTKRVNPNDIEDMVDRRLGKKKDGDTAVYVRRSVFEPADSGPLKSLLNIGSKYPAGRFVLQVEFEGETSAPPYSDSEFTRLCDSLGVQATYDVEHEPDVDVTTGDGTILNFYVEETDPGVLDEFVEGLLRLVSSKNEPLAA